MFFRAQIVRKQALSDVKNNLISEDLLVIMGDFGMKNKYFL